jgi:hypothetical protein
MKNLQVITFVSAGKFSMFVHDAKFAQSFKHTFEHYRLLIETQQSSIEELALYTNLPECDVKELISNVIVAETLFATGRGKEIPN